MIKKVLFLHWALWMLVILASCSSPSAHIEYRPTQDVNLSSDNIAFWQSSPNTIWNQLQHTSIPTLQMALAQSTRVNDQAWLNLGLFSKRDSNNSHTLITELIDWRQTHPQHPGNALFPNDDELLKAQAVPPPKHIALLLPLSGEYGSQGKTIRDGFLNAYYASSIKNRYSQTVSFYDTAQHFTLRDVYQRAISQGADMIVGPLTKQDVQQLAQVANSSVPILALNYTDNHLPSHFYEFGLSPLDEAQQAANKAHTAGGQRAIIIAPQTPTGQKTVRALLSQWHYLGGTVSDTYFFSSNANFSDDIAHLMQVNPQTHAQSTQNGPPEAPPRSPRRQDFDVIFLIASAQNARTIVPLLKYYYAGNIPIYATSMIYANGPLPQKDIDLEGVHYLDIPLLLKNNHPAAAPSPTQSARLYAVGMDAYLLSHELPRLVALKNFPLYASTGALTLNADQHIYRRLPWTQIHEGHP